MDKQIEELANDLQEAWTAWSLSADLPKPWTFVAEILAKKWYPKIPEGVVDYIENYKLGFKEGVVAVQTQLKEKIADFDELRCIKVFNLLDEICKELVDE